MIEARRPTTRPSASISTHFFSISAVLVEYVLPNMMISCGGLAVAYHRAGASQVKAEEAI